MIDKSALAYVLQHFNNDIEAMDVNDVGDSVEIVYTDKKGNLTSYSIEDTDEFEAEADAWYLAVVEANKHYADKKYLLLASLDMVLNRYKKSVGAKKAA